MHRAPVVVSAACLLLAAACGKVEHDQALVDSVAHVQAGTGGQAPASSMLFVGGAPAEPTTPEAAPCDCAGSDFGVTATLDQTTYELQANAEGGVCAASDPPHVRIIRSCRTQAGELSLVGTAGAATPALRVDGDAVTFTDDTGAVFHGTLATPWGDSASSTIVAGSAALTVTDDQGGSHQLTLTFRLCADYSHALVPC